MDFIRQSKRISSKRFWQCSATERFLLLRKTSSSGLCLIKYQGSGAVFSWLNCLVSCQTWREHFQVIKCTIQGLENMGKCELGCSCATKLCLARILLARITNKPSLNTLRTTNQYWDASIKLYELNSTDLCMLNTVKLKKIVKKAGILKNVRMMSQTEMMKLTSISRMEDLEWYIDDFHGPFFMALYGSKYS